MYADDLILVTKANRQTTRNCNLFSSIYARLTCQHLNVLKFAVYYPSWFNKRMVSSINSILGLKCGTFPFTYLGAMVAPKRLKINQFQSLVSQVANFVAS